MITDYSITDYSIRESTIEVTKEDMYGNTYSWDYDNSRWVIKSKPTGIDYLNAYIENAKNNFVKQQIKDMKNKSKKWLKAEDLIVGEWYVCQYDEREVSMNRNYRGSHFDLSYNFYHTEECWIVEFGSDIVEKCTSCYFRIPTNKEYKKLIKLKPEWFEVKIEDCKEDEVYYVQTNRGGEYLTKGRKFDSLRDGRFDFFDIIDDCIRKGWGICTEDDIKYLRKATPKELKKWNKAFPPQKSTLELITSCIEKISSHTTVERIESEDKVVLIVDKV